MNELEFTLRVREFSEKKLVGEGELKSLGDKYTNANEEEGWTTEVGFLSTIAIYCVFTGGIGDRRNEELIRNQTAFFSHGAVLGNVGWGREVQIDKIINDTGSSG